ncbi:MAG TPA: hypothetical protein VIB02_01210 [Candidatus Limnocylindrales bacterium]|jgi:hypothetical protein
MLPDTDLYRAAGASTVVAIIALIVAGITIALFFGGAGAFWGPVNDIFIVFTVLALILPILAIDRLATEGGAGWIRLVTIAAVLGSLLIAVGQTALVLGLLSLQGSFVTGGVGFIPIVVWLVALVVLAFGSSTLPAPIGWAAAAVLALIVVEAVVGMATSGPLLWVASVALLAALVAWLWTLSSMLLSRAPV